MNDIERSAMLGDRQAQEECTRMGIVLACPKCFKPVTVRGLDDWKPTFYDPDIDIHPYEFDCECGLTLSTYKYNFKEALSDWNTRPVLPIGRCKACENWCTGTTLGMKCACQELSNAGDNGMVFTSPYEFCKRFKPKEGEENAAD